MGRDLTPLQTALVEQIDGRRSIVEIIDLVTGSGTLARVDRVEIASDALSPCRSLWEQDLMSVGFNQ